MTVINYFADPLHLLVGIIVFAAVVEIIANGIRSSSQMIPSLRLYRLQPKCMP